MKLSIITATFNSISTIADAFNSLREQTYPEIEHVIIDGGSTDGTLEYLESQIRPSDILSSEPDDGIYDALNKGLSKTTGDVIGLLHSDDLLADPNVLNDVAAGFSDVGVEAVYGDLNYVRAGDTSRIVRHWVAGEFKPLKLAFGWMPPHPTLFLRRSLIERLGGYDTSFRISADYDAILRYFGSHQLNSRYISRVLVQMRTGGASNSSLRNILVKSFEDYRALRKNNAGGVGALISKNARKLPQFFLRS